MNRSRLHGLAMILFWVSLPIYVFDGLQIVPELIFLASLTLLFWARYREMKGQE